MPNMPTPQQLPNYISRLSPRQILIAVIATSAAMFLSTNRKISTALLLPQYVLLPQLLSETLYQSALVTRFGTGLAICLILYLTADHIQNAPLAPESEPGSDTRSGRGLPGEMGLAFRTLTLVLGAFVAQRLWRSYPLPPMPPELTLASYWLMIAGTLVALISLDPLRIGFGLLSFADGFVALYLFWGPGFLVTALLNVVEVLLALGVVLFAEGGLRVSTTEGEMEE
ncbi:MAG: hypothetical protein U9R48_06490 [Chloroflexota bacterium]|nr:hypothetical protein [Chloroflexota bacterium]